MRIYVAFGTYPVAGSAEVLGDPLVIEDDDGARWMLSRQRAGQYPFPHGREDDLHEIRGLSEVAPPGLGIDLVGVAEIAHRGGVSRDSIERWRATPELDFPVPLAELAAGPVWSWHALERWLAVARPPGRPRTEVDPGRRWALGVREGDFVSFRGRARRVLGIRRIGALAPYFRFDDSGVVFSYTREEVGPLVESLVEAP